MGIYNMGCGCKVKEHTRKKLEFKALAEKMEEYVHQLQIGFQRGENGLKKISTPTSERCLRTVLRDISYEYLYKLLEEIQKLMYGNTPEWKRRITDYVEGWTFIQNQVLFNLRLMSDNVTKITSAAIIGQGILIDAERNALQREVDQYADQIIEIATYTIGPNGSPLMHTPARFGMAGTGTDGAQPFLGCDGKKVAIKGSVQFRNVKQAAYADVHDQDPNAYETGVDPCENGLWNFFCEDEGVLDNGDQSSKPTNNAGSHLRYFDNLFYYNASDLNSSHQNSVGKPRVVWADVRGEAVSVLTSCICNGDFNGSYALSELCKKRVGTETMETKMGSKGKHACMIPKNLSKCLLDLQMTQEGFVGYNENALEMAIEQGKMAFEKAYEMQREAEQLIQDAECSLENRANIHALLAVSNATALIC